LQWLQLYLSYRALPKKEGGMSISKTLEEAKNSDTPPSLMPDQATMQKMMMFVFPPMIAVTTYIFPVGL
jgi:membrane protein insertase Oxa1/YidC/SpoIIIJ